MFYTGPLGMFGRVDKFPAGRATGRHHGRMLQPAYEVTDMEDALTSVVLTRFAAGDEPFGCMISLRGVPDGRTLVAAADIERSAWDETRQWILARMKGCTVVVSQHRSGWAWVKVSGPTAEAVEKVEAAIRANAPVVEPDPNEVEVEFWCNAGNRISNETRRIAVPHWNEVANNYPAPVAAALGEVLSLRRPEGQGRLILWHGPPGTGKTTAARALARAWEPWCRTLFVIDPEDLFGHGAYLVRLLLSSDHLDENDEEPTWRLLIIEDADELLRADAKKASGQAMARLLNLADGFLGQGLNLLILLSTNEPIGRLHPAVTRPGRCLAEIHFRPFTRAEAVDWLGQAPAGSGGSAGSGVVEFSLAQLFAERGDVTRISRPDDSPHPGQYL